MNLDEFDGQRYRIFMAYINSLVIEPEKFRTRTQVRNLIRDPLNKLFKVPQGKGGQFAEALMLVSKLLQELAYVQLGIPDGDRQLNQAEINLLLLIFKPSNVPVQVEAGVREVSKLLRDQYSQTNNQRYLYLAENILEVIRFSRNLINGLEK